MVGDNNHRGFLRIKKWNGWLWRVICAVLGFVFGAGVAWGTIRTEISDVKNCTSDHEDRLRDIEKFAPRIDQSLIDINRRLDTIEGKIDEEGR